MTWRQRLAAIRARGARDISANSANSADSLPPRPAAGAIGANGTFGFGVDGRAEKADPAAEAERAAMAQHYAAPPEAAPYRPGEPDRLRDGLLVAARLRPPAWADDTPPPPGAFCACCSRHRPEAGGRWWSERTAPRGWRCWTCHPPVHLTAADIREERT